jgi:hypothetical protein
METINDRINVFELGVNEETKDNMAGISQWMQISAITAFVSTAVSLISATMAYSKASTYASLRGSSAGSSLAGAVIMAIVSIILNILLIQAAGNIKKGLAQSEQGYFNLGLSKMATYFKVWGILIIVLLSIFVLVFFFGMLMR